MELTGKIIAVLDERSGTSARTGTEWRVGSFVLETTEQYPHKMCFEVFGSERLQKLNIQLGETLTVKFDIDSHEYNGRWYNTIRAFDVLRGPVSSAPATQASSVDAPPFVPASSEDSVDDLPF